MAMNVDDKKRKWLSRDLRRFDIYNFHIQVEKPESNEDGDYGDYVYCMHEDAFNEMYPGVHLEPGECREIKRNELELM